MWQDRSIGASSLAAADGKLFLHGENNEVAMVKATHESYQELGRLLPPKHQIMAKPKRGLIQLSSMANYSSVTSARFGATIFAVDRSVASG